MAINNDRNLLEQQILSNSGLKGKELENLKARLTTLSEQQLQAELSKSLSGNNKGEWYTGVMLEHNESVIMRNNHEQTTYTDDSGNEISELKDGDEVLERTIKSTDDKGNVFETIVTYSGGRPLTQTKSKNGNTIETTTYKYNDDADVSFVTVETKKADQSKVMTNVLEIDENGNFDNEDFIDRQTTSMDCTTTYIFTENNCVIEQQVKPNSKKVDTVYKGDSIEDYDNKKLNRVYQKTEQNGEIHEVEYDGNGNTRTVVQNGESPAAIAKKFGVKESSLRKLNPAKGENAITQVGADIVVPGEYDADAIVMKKRKSKLGAMQDFANDEVQRTAERLYSSTMQEVTLDKDYKDAYAYARALLAADGVKNPSNQQVNNKANEILVANGNIKFKKGTKVQITAKAPDSKFVQELSNNGFKPTRENAIFYNRFNALNPTQQQNVLSVIKYCKSQNITDPNQIKARILETFPDINLFDSGKTIPQSDLMTPAYQRKNPVALETFLTETMKLDLKSDVGRTVYERLASLPQDELNKINAQNFSDMSKANFNDIANHLETSGVNIRTQMENQIEQANRDHRAEMLGIPQQKFTSEMLANIYDRAADMMEEYYHNHGVLDAGTYLEGLKNITDWITPDNLFGIDMRSTLHVASDCRKAAQRFRQMHTDNPETFKREYAQLKKDGLVTADYNQQNVQEFMNLIQSGDVDINSDKFKNACKKAFGFKGVENTEKYIQTGQMAGNIGDIAVMLYTLGAASELKMMGKATQGVYGALERGAGRIMSKTAAQKTAKIGTSMAMGGTTLGGFTLGKETLNNLSNPMRDATSWETWKETGIASAESFGFGAFGGLLNETVVAPIVKAIEKPATKATQAVSKALTQQGELTGKQIMETVSESGSLKLDGLFKMNSQEWANLARTATAKGVGFGVEVTGFTAYEAGLDVIKDLIDPKTGRLPDNITVESLTKYLGEKFGEQFSNLGTIKGISQLLMMSKGGKVAQKAMLNEFLSESEALKNIKFKKAEINGHEVYEVTYPNGNRAVVSSPEQAIATCQMAMQMEFLAKSLSEVETPKGRLNDVREASATNPAENAEAKILSEGAEEHPLLTRLKSANDRESFVAIRDEIKKMPNGEEKTQLMQAYLKKYNEWSSDPSRPDIRMEYKPENENIAEQTENTEVKTDAHENSTQMSKDEFLAYLDTLEVELAYQNGKKVKWTKLGSKPIEELADLYMKYPDETMQVLKSKVEILKNGWIFTPEQAIEMINIYKNNNEALKNDKINTDSKEQTVLNATERDALVKEISQIFEKNEYQGVYEENDILERFEELGFDKEKCNTFKTLLEVKVRRSKENSSDREYEFLSLDNAYDLIDIYDTGDKLKACIALLENGVRINIEGLKILEDTCSQNGFYRPERNVAPWSNTIDCTLNEFIAKTAEYLNTVKGNESLEHNIMPDIILQKNSTEIISDALKENPNITFEELIQKFNENNILKLNKVKDSEMKRLALELLGANRFITEDTMQIIMDICNKPQDLLENNRTVDIINNLKKSIKNGEYIKLKDELKNISSYTDKVSLNSNMSMTEIKNQLTQIGVFDHIVEELSQNYGNNETIPFDIINFANEFFNLGKIKFGKEYNRDIKDGYIDPEKYITAEKNRTLRSILEIATDKSGKPNINELNKIMDYLTEHIEKLYVDDLYSFLTYGKNKNGEIDLESVQKVKNAINPNKITYGIDYDFFSSVSSLRHHLKTGNNAFLNDSYDYESYNKLLDSVEKPRDVEQMNSILASIGENIEAKKTFINNPRPTIEFISELQSKGLVRYRNNESDIEGLNLPITEIQIKALDFIKKAKITRDDRKELFDILNNLTKSELLLLEAFFDKYDDGKLSLIIEHIAEFREYDKKSQDAFIKALKNDVFSTYERYDKKECDSFKKSLAEDRDATQRLIDMGVTNLVWENIPDFFNGSTDGNFIKLSKRQREFALRLFEICQEEGNSLSTHYEINNLIANAHPDTYECIENYLKAQKPGKKYYRTVLETVNKVYSENKNAIQEYQDFIKENPEYKDELGIKAGLTALDKFKILAKDKELLNSLFADKDYYISEILTDYDYVTSASIEKSMQNLPELTLEAKTKFPHALGRLFLANLSNQSSKNMADIYNIISKYDKDVALRLENILSKFGSPNNMITYTSNIDYLVDCIKNEPTRGRQLSEQFINNVAFLTRDIKEIENIVDKEGFPRFKFEELMEAITNENVDNAISMLKNYKEIENPDVIIELLSNENKITYKQVQHLIRAIGKDKFNELNSNDLIIACKFISLHGKSNINEIPIADKKDLLHSLVSSNTSLFKISDELSKDFPLIPKNQEEYCSLLPSIVRSLGIETNELTPEQRITMFNSSMGELSKSLAEISDTDFAKMTISQEYPKDKFILDVLDKVKALSKTERQKVYDYFGFELHHNKENSTGFSITGYPVNLNNGKKLAQIKDSGTKAVVEDLRPNVVRFSENNKIKCNNPQVERFLNEVIEALPELRTTIGKKQHGNGENYGHDFDIMQHSLKVMQKVAQDPKFETLNESDQKIMLLASLMHDITKSEGRVDKTHANYGSFDSFFIAQKFNLSKEEEVKLHTVIKQHEWLEYVNSAKSAEQLTKRLQSVAYDLHQGNLFDMAEIFTHADLKAVKVDDSFHDTTEGKSRIGFDGTVRSFGESANIYAERIRGYIEELKKSQPLLPQTKIPRANRINEAITQVNPDGSTNIKGVYKDKDGLVVIKFNEVEDWEAIGFPKGSISHGIEIKKGEKGDAELSEDVNTGNIKFFVHGLDYSNQLAKFDAFSLVDSDALLSVSYAERPESKFRFFRPQGVLLDVNSKYIHGGGNTDAGSGCGKDIAEFKNNYIFGGHRESDRLYISDLIKKATGMTDEQYVDFVEQNKDRPIQEIEPVEIRDKIVKAFATINSNTRKGKREYNEMYISNPNEVMGVFAYSMDYNETIGNPVNFLNRSSIGKYEKGYGTVGDVSVRERTEFLRQYALERNLPFIIFGD